MRACQGGVNPRPLSPEARFIRRNANYRETSKFAANLRWKAYKTVCSRPAFWNQSLQPFVRDASSGAIHGHKVCSIPSAKAETPLRKMGCHKKMLRRVNSVAVCTEAHLRLLEYTTAQLAPPGTSAVRGRKGAGSCRALVSCPCACWASRWKQVNRPSLSPRPTARHWHI